MSLHTFAVQLPLNSVNAITFLNDTLYKIHGTYVYVCACEDLDVYPPFTAEINSLDTTY